MPPLAVLNRSVETLDTPRFSHVLPTIPHAAAHDWPWSPITYVTSAEALPTHINSDAAVATRAERTDDDNDVDDIF